MNKPKLVAGNWKMNTTLSEGIALLESIIKGVKLLKTNTKIAIAPPFTHLSEFRKALKNTDVCLAAQNVSDKLQGAFTGEISALMLKELGVKKAIVAHSERRQYFGETNESALFKIKTLLKQDIHPIYCVGELLEDRERERHFEVVEEQITTVLYQLTEEKLPKLTIAYEPVWAIGTGKTATPEQANQMHEFIRAVIAKRFGEDLAGQVMILYGGSVNSGNASALMAQPQIDGALVGGASLKAEEFIAIIKAAG